LPGGTYISKPKIQIWVNFGGYCNGRCWYILSAIWSIYQPFGLFISHLVHLMAILVYFMDIWYIFPRFGKFHREKSGNPAADRGDTYGDSIDWVDGVQVSAPVHSCGRDSTLRVRKERLSESREREKKKERKRERKNED
jgi:hypothetical protein